MNSPYTPEHFHLAPTITGLALNAEKASELTERFLTEVPRRRIIESMRDGGVQLMLDINGSFSESPEYVFGETDMPDDEKIVNIATPDCLAVDQSPVFAAFLRGMQQVMLNRPDSILNVSAVDRATYGLITDTHSLTPLFTRADS